MYPFKILVLCFLSLGLTACLQEWDDSDLKQQVAEVKKITHVTLEPIPDFPQFESFSYTATSARNPFEPLNKDKKQEASPVIDEVMRDNVNCLRPDRHRNKEYLEAFPLDSLKMVGTISENGETWGLIIDPDGMIHRAQVNNYLGENFGKVVAISGKRIEVREMHNNGSGCYSEREASIASIANLEQQNNR